MWWGNNDQRRSRKEMIKNDIKSTKLQEKAAQQGTMTTTNTPPSLCHSIRTSRGASLESQLSGEYSFNAFTTQDVFGSGMMAPPQFAPSMPYVPDFSPYEGSPYEVDVKTECQTFVNDIETRRDSTLSSYSAYQMPMVPGQVFADDAAWIQSEFHESRRESFAVEEPLLETFVDNQMFELPHQPFSPQHNAMIKVEENDEYLLNHFMDVVLPMIFPALEANGLTRNNIVLPALERNPHYLHACLSASALHLKLTRPELANAPEVDQDIERHDGAMIAGIVQALYCVDNHEESLEATLAMIVMGSMVGNTNASFIPGISWTNHLKAAKDLVDNLALPQKMLYRSYGELPPLNMTLASWIDILGATMRGGKPFYADVYRQMNTTGNHGGLVDLMGCEDKIMFIISEIASLEDAIQKNEVPDIPRCHYVAMLSEQVRQYFATAMPLASPFTVTGAIRPEQVTANITHIFALAARIYLQTLVPNWIPGQDGTVNSINELAAAMAFIPHGEAGYDRALVWPLLIAGSASLAPSDFRAVFETRCGLMGKQSRYGSFGRMAEVLRTVWNHNDEVFARGELRGLHWREAMQQNGWDFLLI